MGNDCLNLYRRPITVFSMRLVPGCYTQDKLGVSELVEGVRDLVSYPEVSVVSCCCK
jgi:hypothetical protein